MIIRGFSADPIRKRSQRTSCTCIDRSSENKDLSVCEALRRVWEPFPGHYPHLAGHPLTADLLHVGGEKNEEAVWTTISHSLKGFIRLYLDGTQTEKGFWEYKRAGESQRQEEAETMT